MHFPTELDTTATGSQSGSGALLTRHSRCNRQRSSTLEKAYPGKNDGTWYFPRHVKQALAEGQVVESYPDDYPIPSLLVCCLDPDPLHVVVAWNENTRECHIITTYRPDLDHFELGFMRRKQR